MKQATMNLQNSDCFDFLKNIQNESIDHIIIDPPYGVLSGHKIETQIDIPRLFGELFRVLKNNGFCVFFGMYPTLPRWSIAAEDSGFKFKDCVVWAKRNLTGVMLDLPRAHEEIMVFRKGKAKYEKTTENFHDLKTPALHCGMYELSTIYTVISDLHRRLNEPQYNELYKLNLATACGQKNDKIYDAYKEQRVDGRTFRARSKEVTSITNTWSFIPESVWELLTPETRAKILSTATESDLDTLHQKLWSFLPENQTSFTSKKKEGINIKHPTVKPLKLMKRLVELVSTEGQTILDCFSGSGSTAVACLETGRNFIGCELDTSYHADSLVRLERAREALQTPKEPMQPTLF